MYLLLLNNYKSNNIYKNRNSNATDLQLQNLWIQTMGNRKKKNQKKKSKKN